MADFLLANLEQVPSFKDNLPTDDNAWGVGNKAHDRHGAHALTASTLTNDTDTLAFLDIVRKVINRP